MQTAPLKSVDPMFHRIGTGALKDDPAYRLGRTIHTKGLPKLLGPLAKSLRPTETPYGISPGWVNGLLLGGLSGLAAGGIYGAMGPKKDIRGKGLTGALIGAGGLGLAGYALNTKDWFNKALKPVPVLNMFADNSDYSVEPTDKPSLRDGTELSELDYGTRQSEAGLRKGAAMIGMAGNDQASIIKQIFMDAGLSAAEKQQLVNGVKNLSSMQAARLKQMLGAVMGAGVGAIVAKYLAGLGTVGVVLSSLMGAGIGGLATKQKQRATHDAFGRPYFF